MVSFTLLLCWSKVQDVRNSVRETCLPQRAELEPHTVANEGKLKLYYCTPCVSMNIWGREWPLTVIYASESFKAWLTVHKIKANSHLILFIWLLNTMFINRLSIITFNTFVLESYCYVVFVSQTVLICYKTCINSLVNPLLRTIPSLS